MSDQKSQRQRDADYAFRRYGLSAEELRGFINGAEYGRMDMADRLERWFNDGDNDLLGFIEKLRSER